MLIIAEARREVETLAADIINGVATGGPARLHDIERQLWPRLLAFGRALLALYFARQFARPRPVGCARRANAIAKIGASRSPRSLVRDHPDRPSRSPRSAIAITSITPADHPDRHLITPTRPASGRAT